MKGRLLKILSIVVWIVACFCFFQANFKYHFYFAEQTRLFLLSGDFLSEFFLRPSWLSCMAGDFLQQFYHYSFVAPAMLSLSLLLLGWASFRAFSMPVTQDVKSDFLKKWIPSLLALALMCIEGRLFVFENACLSSLYSLIGGVAFWLAFRGLSKRLSGWLSVSTFLISGLVCYWMFGYGCIPMVILELLYNLFNRKIPFGVLAFVAIAFAVSGPVAKMYRMEKKDALLYPGPGKWIKYEPAVKVENTLKYYITYCRGGYSQIMDLYEKEAGSRCKETSFIYSLAASQYGSLPDKISLMKEPVIGTSIHLGGNSSMIVSLLMEELYYLVGDMTYAERICMHVNNFSITKRNAYLIRRLAEINLISGDIPAAEKYLRMLDRSIVYRRWAREHTPGQMNADVSKRIENKRQYINRQKEIRTGDNSRAILVGLLNSNKENVIALDYLLCTDILEGNRENFERDYAAYGPRDKALYRKLRKSDMKTRRQK